jgi:hypothetical protein
MDLKQVVETNRGLLQLYSALSRLTGWLLIVWGCGLWGMGLWLAVTTTKTEFVNPVTRESISLLEVFFKGYILEPLSIAILPGLLALMVAQLLRFILAEKTRPGWLLRNGEKVLYLAIAIVLFNAIPAWHLGNILRVEDYVTTLALSLGGLSPHLLLAAARLMILIALAQALRRVMPMIEESKSII